MTGEEALPRPDLATTTGLDLALVAAQLPGIDGLGPCAGCAPRTGPAHVPDDLGARRRSAAEAADPVVGFVQKPPADLEQVVERWLSSRESLQRTREHTYLERIKARHERVLARYRSPPRDP
jgi:hypothetical protein